MLARQMLSGAAGLRRARLLRANGWPQIKARLVSGSASQMESGKMLHNWQVLRSEKVVTPASFELTPTDKIID